MVRCLSKTLSAALLLSAYAMASQSPCPGQPKSFPALVRAFEVAQFPAASALKGMWAKIGDLFKDEPSYNTLNCSGIRRAGKFDFVIVADGYTASLQAVGTYSQRITMNSDLREVWHFRLISLPTKAPRPIGAA
jgi:hypothetical protein